MMPIFLFRQYFYFLTFYDIIKIKILRKELKKMRINLDCCRDVMKALEELIKIENVYQSNGKPLCFDEIYKHKLLKPYSKNDCEYSVIQLRHKGFILGAQNSASVYDIMPAGHRYLMNLRIKQDSFNNCSCLK